MWRRNADGTPLLTVDDVNRKYVLVPEEENETFEAEATRLGWQYTLVGFDDFLVRRTYSLDRLPPQEFKALDLTNSKDVLMVHNKVRFDKRFRTKPIIQKVEKSIDKALNVAMGMMSSPLAERDGAKLANDLSKTVVQMESLNQADEHLQVKNDRLDAGLATENVGMHKTYRIDPETHDQV